MVNSPTVFKDPPSSPEFEVIWKVCN
jgi:hypothetical protein